MPVILETPRLIMRPFTEEDATLLFELNSDPEVVKYTGESVYTHISDVNESILRNKHQIEKYRQGRLSVFIKETGEYIGWCGLRYFPESEETDLGYRLMKKYWGKGYATEAARQSLYYGFNTLNLDKIVGTAMKENTPSIHIFRKLGMHYSHDKDCGCQPGVVYTITKNEWK